MDLIPYRYSDMLILWTQVVFEINDLLPTMSLQITLTKHQWERISEILGNFGLLTFATTVIPAIFEKFNLFLAILGIVITALFWYASIIAARKY